MSGIGPGFRHEATALERAWQQGAITLKEYRAGLRQAGLVLDDEAGFARKVEPLPPLPLEPLDDDITDDDFELGEDEPPMEGETP